MILSLLRRLLLIYLFCLIFKSSFGQQPVPQCGTADSAVSAYLLKSLRSSDLTRARVTNEEKLEYRLALDINYQTFLLYNGDEELIKKTAYNFISQASEIFEREINVRLTVAFIYIWDHQEPYVLEQDYDYYSNINTYWLNNRNEERDAVVSLSCRNGWFYGGGRMCSSNFPEPNNPGLPVDLLCHELGHTLGSPHTHNCNWPGGPIDRCTALESTNEDCQDGYTETVNGSLMSYCRSILSFHPFCQNLMRNYAEGKFDTSFKLNALTIKPEKITELTLPAKPQTLSNSPSFSWKAPLYVDKYHFQIARDETFTQIAEDTMIAQSYFQSAGIGQGNYFARINAENSVGTSDWSSTLPFSVLPFSANSTPPILLNIRLSSDGFISGYFHKYAETDTYEIEVRDEYQPERLFTHELKMNDTPTQSFRIPLKMEIFGRFGIRLRVKSGNLLSTWSDYKYVTTPWNSSIWPYTNLSTASSNPVLATTMYIASLHTGGIMQSFQISTDPLFKNNVYKDSVTLDAMNEWFTDRSIFQPALNENTDYYMRSRVMPEGGVYSAWNLAQFTTGRHDLRFESLTSPSKNMETTNFSRGDFLKNRFYKAGNKLFIYDLMSGYYASSDLKNWQNFTASSTQGKSSNRIYNFGTSNSGEIFVMGDNNVLIKNDGGHYQNYYSEENFYMDGLGELSATQTDGVLFKAPGLGVGQFLNGAWQFYGETVLSSVTPVCLAKDSDDRVWAIMEEGLVWSFKNNTWSSEPYFPNSRGLFGIAFDNDQTCYAYGDWGLARLNRDLKSWEMVSALSGYSIHKIVFDKQNQMWLSSYRYNGQNFDAYALIKFASGKLNVYSDGLNFLNEAFDIEVFNNKLLILTTGGEIHSFEETNVQRLEAKASYCPGDEIATTITSNSTFGKENQFSFLLQNTETGATTTLASLTKIENQLKTSLPLTLPAASYRLRTASTNPEVISNESDIVTIYPQPAAVVSLLESNKFKTIIKANAGEGFSYQWQLNGSDLPNATGISLLVEKPGDYVVSVTNKGGCQTKSASYAVSLDFPSEITLSQNVPNPVSSLTEIAFYLPSAEEVTLDWYNVRGQKMGQLRQGHFEPGWHLVTIDGSKIASGIYIYRLKAGKFIKSLKMSKL